MHKVTIDLPECDEALIPSKYKSITFERETLPELSNTDLQYTLNERYIAKDFKES